MSTAVPVPDVRLYAVTDPALTPPERLVPACLAAVEGGATLVQLRDKAADRDALTARARELVAALAPTGVPLIVNDDAEVAAAAGAGGVHVGVRDVPPSRARTILGPDAIVGWSVEDVRQLDDSDEVSACSYIAASPVWTTPTKSDTADALGLSGIASLRSRTDLPIVAIGGISTPDVAADVVMAGADGVAVVSAVFGAADIRTAALALRAAVDETRQKLDETRRKRGVHR